MSPHTKLTTKYGITKSGLHAIIINGFHIPAEISSRALKTYFTRKWILHTPLQITEGILHYEGIDYLVVFHQCTPYQVRRAASVMCSFRVAQDEYNIPAYVLIKIPIVDPFEPTKLIGD